MTFFLHSINGENYYYGTPTNPCAPDRVPGGSSSGSAVVVGARQADFSLGAHVTLISNINISFHS